MAMAYDRTPAARGPVQKMGTSSSLAEVLNIILDKGIVIDAWARVSVIGIEILTIEARVVVASVETYLRYAEAIGLTALAAAPQEQPVQGGQQAFDRRNGQQALGEQELDEQVLGFLEDHPDGVRLGEMQAYFDVPRRELAGVVNQLVEDDRARRDDEQKLYFPADDER